MGGQSYSWPGNFLHFSRSIPRPTLWLLQSIGAKHQGLLGDDLGKGLEVAFKEPSL